MLAAIARNRCGAWKSRKGTGKPARWASRRVLDRFIQQAIAQVVSARWEAHFHRHSYGFVRFAHPSPRLGTVGCADVLRACGAGRPQRSAHPAVREVQASIRAGHDWVVDRDLQAFFDRVNHDRRMARLKSRCPDADLLRRVNRFLKAGVSVGGQLEPTLMGVPQGGPLSPVLANGVLVSSGCKLTHRSD